MTSIGLLTLVVRDQDEAAAYYCRAIGFDVVQDRMTDDGRRWLVVAPPGPVGPGLLLARAETPEQLSRVGDQTGGRVGFFLHTDNFAGAHRRMLAAGVEFLEQPRYETYGTVAVFQDLYGNKWDLIEHSG